MSDMLTRVERDDDGGGHGARPVFPVSELDYVLPPELIAQEPPAKREDARLLVVDRATGRLRDDFVGGIARWVRPGDLLVLNDTRVLPARFEARRGTGGRLEGLFLSSTEPGRWEVMLRGGSRLRLGETILLGGTSSVDAIVRAMLGDGRFVLEVHGVESAEAVLERIGRTPLPPYIPRETTDAREAADRDRYQTVFARHPGAIAAPTAGLHFTDQILAEIRAAGAEIAYVTLHVGAGTFKPIEVEDLSQHLMHSERYQVPIETVEAVAMCKSRGGRVVAVGTTSARTLEAAWDDAAGTLCSGAGETSLFVYPPYRFRVVDMLLTNFHLPRSTLVALVMAFAGVELIRAAYLHAIEEKYRFFSYGDAMLIG